MTLSTSTRYTPEQFADAVRVYANTPGMGRTQRAVLTDALHPGNGHSIESWAAVFGQLEKLDAERSTATEFVHTKLLSDIASALYPERF